MGLRPIGLGFPKITIYKGLPNNMLCKHKPCLSVVVIIKGKSALFAVIKLWPVTGSSRRIFFSCHFFFSYSWMFGHQIVQELRDVWHSCLRALNKIFLNYSQSLELRSILFYLLFSIVHEAHSVPIASCMDPIYVHASHLPYTTGSLPGCSPFAH